MPQDKTSAKPDIVSAIFSRQTKKRLSSLFAPRGSRPAGGAMEKPGAEKAPTIKKLPFGLDIGTSSIKLLQLSCDQNSVTEIINFAIEELPREAQLNAKERPRLLGEVLQKFVQEKGLSGDCFTALPWTLAKTSLIKLPQMPRHEIDKALRWEVRQTSHADINELSLDYIVLEGQKKIFSDQIGILSITALKKDIFEHLALLESAGLNPLAVDIESLSDLAVLDYAKKMGPEEVVLFLDFGAGKTSLNIICNQELISTRYLNVTGNSLTKAIAEYCNISWEEAEAMKKTFGLTATDKAIQVRNSILSLLENMVQDIEHTFKYFSYQVTQSHITRFDRVILSGGSAYLKELLPYLRNRLNTEVELLDSLLGLAHKEQLVQAGDLSCRFNVALGLALRGIEEL